jgi:hypothetical protein
MEIEEFDVSKYDYDKKIKFLIKNREYIYIITEDDENKYDDVKNHYRLYFVSNNIVYNGRYIDDHFLSKFRIQNIIPLKKEDKMFNLFLCSEFNHYHIDFVRDRFTKFTGKKIKYMELRFNYEPYFNSLDWFKNNRRKNYYEIDFNKPYDKQIYFFVPVLRYELKLEVKKNYNDLKNNKNNILKKFITKNSRYYNI